MLAVSILRRLFNCLTNHSMSENNNAYGISTDAIGGNSSSYVAKVKFGVSLKEAFKIEQIPNPLRELLVYIAREGVSVIDLFRRPGNPNHVKLIIKRLNEGRVVIWSEFNFYTLANVAKRFLLQIPGGVFGAQAEQDLLIALELEDDQYRFEAMHLILSRNNTAIRQLLALLFGIWFRMIYHSDLNTMSVEAVAKSVAGSVFHTCNDHPSKVSKASKVMEVLITGFASAELFGHESIEYFTTTTATQINRLEKFKYEFVYPAHLPRDEGIRLFMTMLMEEAEKHRFDIVNHAVCEEHFLAAHAVFGVYAQSRNAYEELHEVAAALDENNFNNRSLVVGQVTQVESAFVASAMQIDASFAQEDKENEHQRLQQNNYQKGRTPSRRFRSVRRRQLERLAKRSDWFLSPPSGCQNNAGADSLIRLTLPVSSGFELHGGAVRLDEEMEAVEAFKSVENQVELPFLKSSLGREKLSNAEEAGSPLPETPKECCETRYFVVRRFYGPMGASCEALSSHHAN